MDRINLLVIVFALVLVISGWQNSAHAEAESWQLAHLFNPTPAQLEVESRGRVMIYQGLTDTQVNIALDEQFNRVESMMFTGTIVTDEAGRPKQDPVTGQVVVEDDGC
ncbi:hypothetical protein ACFL3A_11390 [Pseudomonadota bacterium]